MPPDAHVPVLHVLAQAAPWFARACHAATPAWLATRAPARDAGDDTLVLDFHRDDARRAAHAPPLTQEDALSALVAGRARAVVLRAGRDAGPALAWLRRLRAAAQGRRPVALVLSPSQGDASLRAALEAGADAVLPHGASPGTVAAQLQRLHDRPAAEAPTAPAPAPAPATAPRTLRLDVQRHRAWAGEAPIPLRPVLFRLLRCLAAEPDRVFGLARLQAAVGADEAAQPEAIHAYVSRLRKALRPHGLDGCVQTVHRVGYRYVGAPVPGAD